MTCHWCATDHPERHIALVPRPDWDGESPGPFLPPGADRPVVILTPDEIAWCLDEARKAQEHGWRTSMEQGRDPDVIIDARALGNRGELALANYLGVPWHPTRRTGHLPDVALCHVRATRMQPPVLAFRRDEVARPPRGPFVLVSDSQPAMTLVGWTTLAWCARNIQERVLREGRGPVPLVTQGHLRPVVELVTTHRAMAGIPPASEAQGRTAHPQPVPAR